MKEYFLDAFGITAGILSPFMLFAILKAAVNGVNELIERSIYFRNYSRYMDPKYWHFREVKQCPNPDYIDISFLNNASREIINLALEKKHLKGFVK